ncbi:M-phase phosphoprotein 6-like [Haliotis rubra]|uniref:M-phase phosphoprotein 6-like n=1 Tax=Haliotis rubra TaxID=36100 RepID=UPI001EE5300C|nr:M-phase phosphoprotein 6-like [Haliotis rubra]
MANEKNSSYPTKLSKNVLQMKFMQRSVLRIEKEQNEEENNRAIDDEHWVMDVPPLPKKQSRYDIQPSYVVCENLCYGRMSFKGFNPDVEKLMAIHNTQMELDAAEEREKETHVSEDEMAERYKSLVGIIAKKFKKKRKQKEAVDEEAGPSPEKKGRQFQKPSDD